MTDFNWTDEAVAELRRLCAEVLSFSQIASALNSMFGADMTRNAVIGKALRIGIPKRDRVVTVPRAPRKPRTKAGGPKSYSAWNTKPDAEPVELVIDLAPDTSDCAVTLMQLEPHHCRWPLGDPQSPDFKFCGANNHGERPYCARHCRLAYNGFSARREGAVSVMARQRGRRRAMRNSFRGEAA